MSIRFDRHCWAEVDLDAICHNFALVRQAAGGAGVLAVVKANAYGHGDIPVARALGQAGAAGFAVSSLGEALRLREAGIGLPLLVMGYTDPACAAELAKADILQAVFSSEYAAALSAAATAAGVRCRIHIKADTGMSRLGFPVQGEGGAEEVLRVASLPGLLAEGIFTHFASADTALEDDVAFTRRQQQRFEAFIALLAAQGLHFSSVHCCNSGGIVHHGCGCGNLVRAGILLYGCPPGPGTTLAGLRPALRLRARVTMVKTISPGDAVSYGRTFTAEQPMRVATVAAGYADGYPRALSNLGTAGFEGQPLPVIGRVCMDQLVVDAGACPTIRPGDAVTLYGGDGADPTATAAEKAGLIPYDLLCAVGLRVPRLYCRGGQEDQLVRYI